MEGICIHKSYIKLPAYSIESCKLVCALKQTKSCLWPGFPRVLAFHRITRFINNVS